MKEKIKEIFKQLYKDKISLEDAEQQVLDLFAVMPSVCAHPITYATYTKFCPRKCLMCGEFVK